MHKQKIIIISAINIFEGGPLSILNDNLTFINNETSNKYLIYVLVHKKELFNLEILNKINFIEFPKSRKSYIYRLYYEFFYFKKLSKKLEPYLWFSLHDITPNVIAKKRVVYCHNATPFKKVKISDLYFQPTVYFFSLFYKYLYKINIKKNKYIVVQQKWLKDGFEKMFDLDSNKLLVCYPENNSKINNTLKIKEPNKLKNIHTFFYPALARPFKNFEVIGEAVKQLNNLGITNFQVLITIKGNENRYAKYIEKKYGKYENFKFIGKRSFQEVTNQYEVTDTLIFPSTLETWGLPISEFKPYNKPIILSDLPFAKETLGMYEKALFFEANDHTKLANIMISLIKNDNPKFDITNIQNEQVLIGWKELYDKILED